MNHKRPNILVFMTDQLLQFKARTVSGFYRQTRERLDAMGMEKIKLSANGGVGKPENPDRLG